LRFQPLLEIPNPNLMLNRRLADHDRDSRQTSTDIIDPIVLAKRSQALSYRFIKRIGRNLDHMLDPFKVAATYPTSAKAHGEQKYELRLLFAIISRPHNPLYRIYDYTINRKHD
jgi:hypothetical protein